MFLLHPLSLCIPTAMTELFLYHVFTLTSPFASEFDCPKHQAASTCCFSAAVSEHLQHIHIHCSIHLFQQMVCILNIVSSLISLYQKYLRSQVLSCIFLLKQLLLRSFCLCSLCLSLCTTIVVPRFLLNLFQCVRSRNHHSLALLYMHICIPSYIYTHIYIYLHIQQS